MTYINRELLLKYRKFHTFVRKSVTLYFYLVVWYLNINVRNEFLMLIKFVLTQKDTILSRSPLQFRTMPWHPACCDIIAGGETRTSNKTKGRSRRFDILYTVMAISRALRSWAQEGVFREEENEMYSSQEIGIRTVWPATSFPKTILSNPITHVARHYSARWVITV